ncbi:MAG: HNH endonuclease [Bacteroidetes bacterium]|nr:HNH endonuclease [Bacteroidota bacterium]
MSHYSNHQWKEFRDHIIELDGYKCAKCGRSNGEVILQVHHKTYIKGKKPWEYPLKDCMTLCKGCHATVHGIFKPQFGWEYVCDEDLEELVGTCENCGNDIRYVFTIQHEKWGTMEVGTYCCDKLTDSDVASNLMESLTSYRGRLRRFIDSSRWKLDNDTHTIRQGQFNIEIREDQQNFNLKIHTLESKKIYHTLSDAKSKAFEVIDSGQLIQYCDKNKINLEQSRKKNLRKV